MLQKELSKFHASKRTVKIPCFKKNCQNSTLQKELSKIDTSKRIVKIFHPPTKQTKNPTLTPILEKLKKLCSKSKKLYKKVSAFFRKN
jgi:hypothetical protein